MDRLRGGRFFLPPVLFRPPRTRPPGPVWSRAWRAAKLAGYAGAHQRVGREFLHEEEQALDGFNGLVAGEAAADDADLVQVGLGQKQFFAAGPTLEDIDGRVDALVADLAIEDELHVAGALELLEDELIHAAVGLDEG